MLRKMIILAAFLFAPSAMAGAEYDREKNVVELSTPLLAENIDNGWITIYSEKHIKIMGSAFDESGKKLIGMCGRDPSLGLLFLDGNLKLGAKVPKVTDTESLPNTKENKEGIKAGWVVSFILKGDDALDLMDLLYEYRTVGFAMLGEGCSETKNVKSGKIILNFETRGLDRAMKRLK